MIWIGPAGGYVRKETDDPVGMGGPAVKTKINIGGVDDMKTALDFCLRTLSQREVDKFQCSLKNTRQYEMNLEGIEFSLIRTTVDNTLQITVIKDQRKGTISVNRLDEKKYRGSD